MKNIFTIAAIATLLACTTNTMAEKAATTEQAAMTEKAALAGVPSGEYQIDKSHAYISFTYSHLGFSTPHVGFRAFDVGLNLDNENPENSTVKVVIDTASVDSRVEDFNGHLRGGNFFDTDNFPQATFVSTAVRGNGEGSYDVAGELTIKDVTKPVNMAMKINKAAMHPMKKVPTVGVSGETKVNRSDFGMDRFVPNVGDEVTIYVTAELFKSE